MTMTHSASNMDIRRINKARIFRYLLRSGKISIQEIATHLALSIPTVQQNVKTLISSQLVKEDGMFNSTGGRKAKAIVAIAHAHIAYGVDITANHISMVKVDLAGNILENVRQLHSFSDNPSYFEQTHRRIDRFMKETCADPTSIIGIGFSIPGIISRDGASITYSHALRLRDFSCAPFDHDFSYPCLFINDANAGGYAEIFNHEQSPNMLYLSLSNSVGGAFLYQGVIYNGDNMRAAELGHCTLIPNGKPCYCGKLGCFDTYCSAKRLSDHTHQNLAAFFAKLANGDPACVALWEEYTDNLAIFLNSARMAFDADIRIGGYVGGYIEPFLPALREKVIKLHTFESDATYLKACSYRLEASAVGAALQLIDLFIEHL